MAAGLGYIEFSTGDVLTATAANGYLASQVVMVFASAAARTSAIASPQEGMFSYLKDTNATEYYSGSAWVAVGGASGGMTLLDTVSLSGSSTTSATLSSSYKQFFVYMNQLLGTETTGMRLRLNGDTGSNYAFNAPEIEGAFATERNVGTTSFRCGYASTGSTVKQKSYMGFTITRPSDTGEVLLQGSGYVAVAGTSATYYAVAGVYDSSAAITSMTFFPSAGTVTGTAYIYGVN
jgi:hypothetical protein